MALEDNGAMNSMVMPVSPMYGGYGNNGGMFGGDSWAWIILLLLLGWGNNSWGNNAGNGNTASALYPWMNQTDITNAGFRDQMLNGSINSIQSGVQGIGTQLCNGFAGVNATVNTGFANAETAANARQMANMQQIFANQTAMSQGFNGLASQLANCCCENRLASANLQSVVQTENCADRAAISDGIRDIIASQTAGFQSIKDQLCQDKIDAKNEEIANLRTQLNMANLAASQGAQTAQLISDNNAQTAQLINRIAPYPIPSWTVPNPYAYANNGYGCGCNA